MYIVSGLITITVHQLKRFEIVLVTVLVVTFFRRLALIRSKIEKAWHVSDIGICLSHLYWKFCFLLAIFAILVLLHCLAKQETLKLYLFVQMLRVTLPTDAQSAFRFITKPPFIC